MQLGERIYQLRTAKNLSQGDLAERLDVSRQSISKWENNNATPDLEKILKLSEVFGISLDELVKGEVPMPEPAAPISKPSNGQKTAGIVLFGLAAFVLLLLTIMGGFAVGLMLAVPFLVCGTICMVCKRHAGLWCAWAAAIMVDLFLRYATGLSWGNILHSLRWTPEMNYARLAIAWVQFLVILVLICVTAVRLRPNREADKKRLFLSWGLVLLLTFILWALGKLFYVIVMQNGGNIGTMEPFYVWYNLAINLFDWTRILAFSAALTETLRYKKPKNA